MTGRKKVPDWEMADPKVPVIQSGHMENRVEHGENMQDPVDKNRETGI